MESRNFYVPGIIALLSMLVTLILTCMAIVREREIGTIEQMIVSPIRPVELILGKTIPFAIVGYMDVALVTIMGVFLFEVPIRGSLPLLLFEEGEKETEKRDPLQEENMENEQVTKMQADFVDLQKRLSDAEARAKDSETKIAKFEAEERERQILKQAETLVAATPIGTESVATLLKQLDTAGVTALEGILKATRAAVADAQIFTELGSAAGVTVGNEVETIAADIQKAEPKLTKEQAIAKAYRQNPNLYDAALKR